MRLDFWESLTAGMKLKAIAGKGKSIFFARAASNSPMLGMEGSKWGFPLLPISSPE